MQFGRNSIILLLVQGTAYSLLGMRALEVSLLLFEVEEEKRIGQVRCSEGREVVVPVFEPTSPLVGTRTQPRVGTWGCQDGVGTRRATVDSTGFSCEKGAPSRVRGARSSPVPPTFRTSYQIQSLTAHA